MPYTLADQHDPLITMRIHGWMTDADFERSMNDLAMLDERGRPHVIVLDCSGLRVPEIGQIRQLRAWFASSSSSTVRHRRALACVADTPMLRGTIRALMQFRPPWIAVRMFEDPDAAHRWAAEQLAYAQSIAS